MTYVFVDKNAFQVLNKSMIIAKIKVITMLQEVGIEIARRALK